MSIKTEAASPILLSMKLPSNLQALLIPLGMLIAVLLIVALGFSSGYLVGISSAVPETLIKLRDREQAAAPAPEAQAAFSDQAIEEALGACMQENGSTGGMNACYRIAIDAYAAIAEEEYNEMLLSFDYDIQNAFSEEARKEYSEGRIDLARARDSQKEFISGLCGAVYASAGGGSVRTVGYNACELRQTKLFIAQLCSIGYKTSRCEQPI